MPDNRPGLPDNDFDGRPGASAAGPPLRVVIAGLGMAGGRLVDDILARARDGRARRQVKVSVVGAEPYGAYNRVLLSDVVAGRADVAALALQDPEALRAAGVDVQLGEHVDAVDLPCDTTAPGAVLLSSGARLVFDRLVLATGAEPVVPPLDGLGTPDRLGAPEGPGGADRQPLAGVHVLRTVDDAREIVAACANARTGVVLGGGLLGLEAARGLARRGLTVTVLHSAAHLLEGRLDAAGAAVLARTFRGLGMTIRCGVSATGAVTDPVAGPAGTGRLRGIRLSDGEVVPADLLVLACGVRARTAIATAAGLDVARGVLVDDTLTTSDPRVLAIGDCAEHEGRLPGLVAPAWAQAGVVADRITGSAPDARWAGHQPVMRLKAADVEVSAVGACDVDPWSDDPGTDVVQLLDPGAGRYVKAVVRNGVVVGAATVGDARAAADLSLLVERGAAAPVDRTCLVTGARRSAAPDEDPTRLPDRSTVCRCNGVTKGAILRAWSAGSRTRQAMAASTRATTGCGSCTPTVDGLVSWLSTTDPDDERLPASARPSVPASTGGAR
ncbi:MAG: FAD-dependent oxidoreductase [Dermatophilaceae bacterium]